MISDVIDPPAASGNPVFRALMKNCANDFRVAEDLTIDFSQVGEHLYLQVEKTAMNTDEVLALLAQSYSVQSNDIGLCGLKDRHAVTSQWFSVRTPLDVSLFEDVAASFNKVQTLESSGSDRYIKSVRILDSHRHSKKLKRGAHDGNQFVLILRQIQAIGDMCIDDVHSAVARRVNLLAKCGFPNYIGVQRFGYGAQNIQRARQWFAHPKKRCSRLQRSLWLSSARSALFNVVCAARVRQGSWQCLLEGEPVALNGSRSFFILDSETALPIQEELPRDAVKKPTLSAFQFGNDENLKTRLATFDIHPSAPWWGRGPTPALGACAELELQLLAPHQDLCDGLERAGLAQERRALRTRANDLSHRWLGEDELELRFYLPPGVFATTLLRELCIFEEQQR